MPFEPITALTDYAIALESFIFVLLLLRRQPKHLAIWGWAIVFLGVAIAAIIGGILHSVSFDWDRLTIRAWWLGLILTLGLTSFSMLVTTVWSELSGRSRWLGLAIAVSKSVIYLFPYVALIGKLMIGKPIGERLDFVVVALDYLTAMVLVTLLQGRSLLRWQSPHSSWCLAGIFVSGLATVIQGSGVRVMQVVNHNDLYHLVQMFGLFCFYRSAALLKREAR
jgi:hypothetical protein